jgi:predicted ATP-dependent endonuclease of OLD family
LDLHAIEVHNFKAFREARIDFPARGLVLVVGPNNAGKSGILSAVDAVRQLAPPAERHVNSDDPSRIVVEFSLTADERLTLLLGVESAPRLVEVSQMFGRIKLTYQEDDSGKLRVVHVFGWDEHETYRLMGTVTTNVLERIEPRRLGQVSPANPWGWLMPITRTSPLGRTELYGSPTPKVTRSGGYRHPGW